jgi:hypothetical protein
MDEYVDLPKKYGFKIINRDIIELSALDRNKKYLFYVIMKDDELLFVTTNKYVNRLRDLTYFGLNEFSGHGANFIEKDYEIILFDIRDEAPFDEKLYLQFINDEFFSENTENVLKNFFRRVKIKSLLSSK